MRPLGMGLEPWQTALRVDSWRKVCLGMPRWVEFREEVLKLENGREVLFSGRVNNADVPWVTDRIRSVVEVCHSVDSMLSFDAPHSVISLCWSCPLSSLHM